MVLQSFANPPTYERSPLMASAGIVVLQVNTRAREAYKDFGKPEFQDHQDLAGH